MRSKSQSFILLSILFLMSDLGAYNITSSADSGDGTLRQGVLQTQAQLISVLGSSGNTITLVSDLSLNYDTTLDGSSNSLTITGSGSKFIDLGTGNTLTIQGQVAVNGLVNTLNGGTIQIANNPSLYPFEQHLYLSKLNIQSGSTGTINIGANSMFGFVGDNSYIDLSFNNLSIVSESDTGIFYLNIPELSLASFGQVFGNPDNRVRLWLDSGTLEIEQSSTTGGLLGDNGVLSVQGTITLYDDDEVNIAEFSGDIVDLHQGATAATVVKSGPYRQVFIGTNTYTGGTTINQGTLTFYGPSSLPTEGLITLNGGTLGFGGTWSSVVSNNIELSTNSFISANENTTVTFKDSQTISGTGSLTKTGLGTIVLQGSSTYSGGTTITEGTLKFVGSSSLPLEGSTITLNGGTLALNRTPGLLTVENPVFLRRDSSISVDPSVEAAFPEIVSGNGALTKTGEGTLILNGINSYTGATTINQGTLRFLNRGLPSSSAITVGNGTLEFGPFMPLEIANPITLNENNSIISADENVQIELSGVISGSGRLNKRGEGIVLLSGNNTYTGGTTINQGTLKIIRTNSLPEEQIILVGGTLGFGPLANVTVVNDINLTQPSTIDCDEGYFGTLSGNISQNSPCFITKTGAGTITLSGTNNYTGGTTINQGSLIFNSSASVPTRGIITLNQATLGFGGEGAISTAADIILLNNSQLLIQDRAVLNYSGAVQYDDNSWSLNFGSSFPEYAPKLIIPDLKSLTFSGIYSDLTNSEINIVGTLNVENSMGSSFSGKVTGNGILNVRNTILTLSGDNTYNGQISISSANLRFESQDAISAAQIFLENGGLSFGGDSSLSINLPVNITGTNNLSVDSDTTLTFSSSITGSGSLIKENPGNLIFDTNASFNAFQLNEGGLNIRSGKTLTVNNSFVSDVDTLLSGEGTIEGPTEIYGTIAPGNSIGTLNIVGDYTQGSGSTYDCEIQADGASDRIAITGNLFFDNSMGDTTFNLIPLGTGFNPDQSFDVMTYTGTRNGTFGSITSSSPLISGVLNYDEMGTVRLILILNGIPLNGSFNQNAVATVINALADQGSNTGNQILRSLASLNQTQLHDALDQMIPALFKGATIVAENNAYTVENSLWKRIQLVLDRQFCPEICQDCSNQNRKYHLWIDGFGSALNQESKHNAYGSQFGYGDMSGGVTLGFDYMTDDKVFFGLLGAYTNADVNWESSQGKADIQSGYAGAYFGMIKKYGYGHISIIEAYNRYHESRRIDYPGVGYTAHQHHGGLESIFNLNFGGLINTNIMTLQPFESLLVIAQKENSFTENGAGIYDLHVRSSSAGYIRNEIGMNFSRCNQIINKNIIVDFKTSWIYESRPDGAFYTASFVGTNPTFKTGGYFPNRSLLGLGGSIALAILQDKLNIKGYYDAQISSSYWDQNFGIQLGGNF